MIVELNSPIAILGGGGLGSNLCSVLIEQGYKDILLVDDDTSDSKFLSRYAFFGGIQYTNIDIPKTDVITRVIKCRIKDDQTFNAIHAKINEHFNYQKLLHKFCIITVDSIESRTTIERNLKANNIPFIHVGCNLNSVSIFKTMDDVLGDEEIAGATTSYDTVPDFATYMVACTSIVSYLSNVLIKIWVE